MADLTARTGPFVVSVEWCRCYRTGLKGTSQGCYPDQKMVSLKNCARQPLSKAILQGEYLVLLSACYVDLQDTAWSEAGVVGDDLTVVLYFL